MSNDSYYESLLHSMRHEHTRGNIERHVLGFEKWSRTFAEGIFICDLDNVIALIEVLEERLASHPALFEPVLLSFFEVCSKALLESKGNERLRSIGIERIKGYYLKLAKFSHTGNLTCRSACIKMFRCILNAGIDPTLITNNQPTIPPKENSAQVIDKIYIHNLIRESGTVEIIATELFSAYTKYSQNLKDIRTYQNQLTTTSRRKKKVPSDNDFDDEEFPVETNQAITPSTSREQLIPSNQSYDPDDSSQFTSINQSSETLFTQLKDYTFQSSEYCRMLIELSLELSVDVQSACILCQNGYVCNALMIAISEELLNTHPDHSLIAKFVELLWNCLESYVNTTNTSTPNSANPPNVNLAPSISSPSLTTINPSQSGFLLQSTSSDIIKFQTAIPVLRQLLRKLVFHGYCHSDKEIRNEVIIVLHLLISFPKSIPHFIHSGLLNDLVTFASYGEMGRKGWTFYSQPLPKLRNFSTVTEIDIQLKKELWLLIGELLAYDDPDIITCVASSSFMNVLFHYLEQSSFEKDSNDFKEEEREEDGEEGSDDGGNLQARTLTQTTQSVTGMKKSLLNKTMTLTTGGDIEKDKKDDLESSSLGSLPATKKKTGLSSTKKGSDASKLPLTHLLEIQILAMSILAGNAHRMMAEFIAVQGPKRSLAILCQYSNSPSSDHKTLVYQTFLLLNRCLMISNVVIDKLIELNGIEIFLYYFDHSDENITRAQSIKLLTVMCSSSLECQQQLRALNGIESLVKALVKYNERKTPLVGKNSGVKFVTLNEKDNNEAPSNDDSGSKPGTDGPVTGGGDMNVFAISLLSCIWKAIVGNKINEIIFAEKEGIDALFDMLEVSAFLTRSMILRLLSDLLQNRRLVSYAYAWRSFRTVRSIGQILAHCWMDEEVRLNCIRGQDGVVCNLWNILGNHSWPAESTPPELIFSDTGELMAGSLSTSQLDSNGIGNGQSQIVKRLNSAILASRAGTSTAIQTQVRSKLLQIDLRGIITAIFQSLGFLETAVVGLELIGSDEYLSYVYDEVDLDKQETKPKSGRTFLRSLSSMGADTKPIIISEEEMLDQNLSPTDKQVISVCMRYDTLREGEWWNTLLEELKQDNVVPIDADLNMIEDMRERVFASARAIQFEQMELSVVRLIEKQSEEDVFFNHIIQQKNQQIKSEYLKRKSGRKN